MPDLSILIEMAEFYHVEVKELIDGERKGEHMDKELKETLTKVADYNKAEKEKAVKAGNTAFAIMYAICAVMIVIQLAVTANLTAVAGETAVLLIGGFVYLGFTVYNDKFFILFLTTITVIDIFITVTVIKGQGNARQCKRRCAYRSDILYIAFPLYTEARLCHHAVY